MIRFESIIFLGEQVVGAMFRGAQTFKRIVQYTFFHTHVNFNGLLGLAKLLPGCLDLN